MSIIRHLFAFNYPLPYLQSGYFGVMDVAGIEPAFTCLKDRSKPFTPFYTYSTHKSPCVNPVASGGK